MPNALTTTRAGIIIGHARLPKGKRAKGAVHDGDTASVAPHSYMNSRLLGVDAPESTFRLPGARAFTSTGGPDWVAFLDDPFEHHLPPFDPPLPNALDDHLRARTGPGSAANHAHHAAAARAGLVALVNADIVASGQQAADFALFMAFGHDVLDRYGRFLTYLHRDDRVNKPPSYNERLLDMGLVVPYFIWPNVDPFLRHRPLPVPGEPITGRRLDRARVAVTRARSERLGIFEAAEPLSLLPFELRYLAQIGPERSRPGPTRWLIDMGKATSWLLAPHRYIELPNYEDRLFVSSEFVGLFQQAGWRLSDAAPVPRRLTASE